MHINSRTFPILATLNSVDREILYQFAITMKKTVVAITLLFAVAAASDDQDYWIKQAEENANKDLDQWPQIVNTLISDNDPKPVEDQIDFFKSQVSDSVENMNSFVPRLTSIIYIINSTAAGEPNFIRRGALQTILWFINGKRDNKSYYLLDGAVNWVSKRVSEFDSKGDRATALASKLTDAEKLVSELRDALDSSAQNYVKGITKIEELSSDISANIEEIRALANGILTALQNSVLLQNAATINDSIRDITV